MANTGNAAKRTEIIEPIVTEDGELVFNIDRARDYLDHLLSTLLVVGGAVRIVSDRVLIGKLPPDGAGRREPMGATVGLIIEWTAAAPLHDVSATMDLLARSGADEDEEEEESEPAPALMDELAEGLEDDGDHEDHEEG
jgi:hypothetical protein